MNVGPFSPFPTRTKMRLKLMAAGTPTATSPDGADPARPGRLRRTPSLPSRSVPARTDGPETARRLETRRKMRKLKSAAQTEIQTAVLLFHSDGGRLQSFRFAARNVLPACQAQNSKPNPIPRASAMVPGPKARQNAGSPAGLPAPTDTIKLNGLTIMLIVILKLLDNRTLRFYDCFRRKFRYAYVTL